MEGCHILDLGSVAGQDAYVLAQFVGEQGLVTGVDATDAQLEVANRHLDWHRQSLGYIKGNVRFIEGDIEKLDALDLAPSSIDIIVSNCVINLVADKGAVLGRFSKRGEGCGLCRSAPSEGLSTRYW